MLRLSNVVLAFVVTGASVLLLGCGSSASNTAKSTQSAKAPAGHSPASPAAPAGSGRRFTYTDPAARRVYLASSFNAWARNAGGKPTDPASLMSREMDGTWSMTVTTLPEIVRYKFITEDEQGRFEWHADPAVTDHDRDGNSVLISAAPGANAAVIRAGSPAADVRVDPASGQIVVVLRDPKANNAFRDALVLPGLSVDGKQQSKLREPVRASDQRFGGSEAKLEIETVSPRAVALHWRPADGAVHEFEASIQDNSRYYGGGERFNTINQKGVILSMGSLDRPEDKGLCSYKPVPFIISSRGYGLWLDSTSPSTFDLNSTERETIKLRDRSDHFRLVIIAGSTPAEILAEFSRLTGRAPVPPAWAFAPWKSRDAHFNRDEVIADAELNRKHDLPASVIVIDSPWETSYNNFILNEQQFTQPAEMFARIRQLGFVPCLWLTPFINQTNVTDMKGIDAGPASNFQEASDRGYLVKQADGSPLIVPWWKGTGGLVDFTNPAAAAWWQSQLDQIMQWDVAALKCDDGESNFVTDAKFFDGSRASDMKGRYAQLYLKNAHDFLERHRPGDNTLISRCGFTGTGQYPFGWAGDNQATFSFENGLPGVIMAAQNASLSGLPFWGCDIAGYIGNATPELFIRWTQFASCTPLMMVHMQSNKGPWDYGDQALNIYRTFARLHTRLYPYLDNAAHEASESGTPIIRPMVLAFPDDAQAADCRYQYMFGPDLLVAPIYQSGTHRSVYLPKGAWTDYWTGRSQTGPLTFEADAPLERMPLYVRAGAVIPMLPPDIDTLVKRTPELDPAVVTLDDRRVIEVWPGSEGRSGMTTHDGLSMTVTSKEGQRQLTLTSDRARPVEVRLRFVKAEVRGEGPGGERFTGVNDGADTVVSVPEVHGNVTLSWEPKSSS